MKRNFLLVIFTTVLTYCCVAAIVPEQKAEVIAINFFKVTYPDVAGHTALAATLKYTRTESDNSVDFYVFDITPVNGFVIVAGNDIITPILAYSNEGYFNTDFRYKTVNSWVNKASVNIHRAVQLLTVPTFKVAGLWQAYAQGIKPNDAKSTAVAPLVTTTWDQENDVNNPPPFYYNLFCPYDSTDHQRALTGCVATAQAQIMKFWNYPPMGTDSFKYDDVTPNYSNNYGEQYSNFEAHTYQWQLMPTACIGTETNAQDSAVDLLMYDCAVSVGMDFGDDNQNGSGANGLLLEEIQQAGDSICSQTALVKYFGYDYDSIRGIYKVNFTDSVWLEMIEHEMNVGRPVLYEGNDTAQGGHAWVCDGYDVNNNLHMNWGWGGSDNGYFAINNLTTSGNFNPILEDDALIGIMPKPQQGGTAIRSLNTKAEFSMFPNPAGNEVIIKLDDLGQVTTMNLMNILGQTVISENLSNQHNVIDLSSLAGGVYLVQLKQGGNFAIKQLVVTK